MTSTASRNQSPSPPPTAPIQMTPGIRASEFTKLYNLTLTSTLRSIPYESFASCFPTIASSAPEALKSMHKGLVERLEKFAKEEFEMILQERRVVERLNGLDSIVATAQSRKGDAEVKGDGDAPIPPHSLPPSNIISTHLKPLHVSQQSLLNAKMQTTASQNAQLAAELHAQRNEIEDLLSLAESLVRDVEGSGQMMQDVVQGGEGLSAKAREAEGVLSAN